MSLPNISVDQIISDNKSQLSKLIANDLYLDSDINDLKKQLNDIILF